MDISYIRGFFDRLCSVDGPNRSIVLTTANVDLGRHVGARIRREGIACQLSLLDGGSRIKLRVSGRQSLQRWHRLIGFTDPDKMTRLLSILASYGGEDGHTAARRAEGEDKAIPKDLSGGAPSTNHT